MINDKKDLKAMFTNLCLSIADNQVKANAEFSYNAGLKAEVIRSTDGNCCEWCDEKAGRYTYPDVPEEVYKRHQRCGCTVTFKNEKGRYQDVHNKKFLTDKEKEERLELYFENIDFLGKKDVLSFFNAKNLLMEVPVRQLDITSNIYVNRKTKKTRQLAKLLDTKINVNKEFGKVDKIFILKKGQLGGIASYNYVTNSLFISEELATTKGFKKLVDSSYFAAENISDLLVHELGGHKAHWEAVKKYQEVNKITNIKDAKHELEKKLLNHIKNQYNIDNYLFSISENAHDNYISISKIINENRLNELIADAKILIDKGVLEDEELGKLIKEILEYDGYAK